jgi:serine/threonine protein kinase
MQYIPGRDLGHVFHEVGPFLPLRVVAQGFQVARGLAHAHARGVVHRDIKPSNLLLGDDGHVRILDFGHGTFLESELGDAGGFATTEGCAVGTVEYMSPEQAAGKKADGRSDLFSLGCVMYHLITGQIPFPGESKVECLASRIKGRPLPIELLEPDLPDGLAKVVDRLMANRPDDRYPTALEAAQALKAILVAARNGGSRGIPERELVPAASRSESDFFLVTEADPQVETAPIGEPSLTLEEPTPELVRDPGGDSEVIAGSMEPQAAVEPAVADHADEAIDLEEDGLELWEAPVAAPIAARKSSRRSVRSLVALAMATAATILVGLIAQAMGR